jgi:pyruvate,orthophosphate dikinase
VRHGRSAPWRPDATLTPCERINHHDEVWPMAVGTRGKKSSRTPARKTAARKTSARSTGSQNGAVARAHKWVYSFNEGSASMRDLLGGKGAGVAEMTRAGLPVPPGFTITTEACNAFYTKGAKFPDGLWEQVEKALKVVEKTTGKGFGDPRNPLLVSVRSGAKFSMPGMMDTVLNLGLNSATLEGLAKLTKDRRFALDAQRRFIQLFSKIVLGIDGQLFEDALDDIKKRKKAKTDADLSAPALEELIVEYRAIVKRHSKTGFPEEPMEQLRAAIGAVFESWNNKRATDYRNYNRIPHDLGTAVNVQSMVFGNMGDDSGTGVAFTRDPSTGEKKLYGEYLTNAQGEDVVAGIRTPKPIAAMATDLPKAYKQFEQIARKLEKHYRDVQDMEFTIERGTLYMLQTRSGKRTAEAAVKIAVDMVRERLITKREAVLRVEPGQVDQLLHRRIDPKAKINVLATGLAASPGAAYGKAVFDADRAEELAKKGEKVILVRIETNPDDVHGMIAAEGVLTSRGGRTSHAAVVARGMGKPCVAGAESVQVDLVKRQFTAGGTKIKEGEPFTIDGSTGNVIEGQVPMLDAEISGELEEILRWADSFRRLEVWANGDYPHDAVRAREFGAQGIGLCRTEHMFMQQERLPIVQKMILAPTEKERRIELAKLLPMQRDDFHGILKAMHGLPVIIRLIDPPLHEFLPSLEELLVEVTRAQALGKPEKSYRDKVKLLAEVQNLHEQNPMLGLRGCRLGLLFPEIIEMQTRAIIEAAVSLKKERIDVRPEIMVPLVGTLEELRRTREVIDRVAQEVFKETKTKVTYLVGTMIEVPRAALTAGQIAQSADFFSFGTNDLTQMTFGVSRDDAEGKFLLRYVEEKILPRNPFETLDRDGIGRLMRFAVEEGRAVRPSLSVGICGEHGGDADSIALCEELGLDYVSCSPFRVPAARMAAAHARLARVERDR